MKRREAREELEAAPGFEPGNNGFAVGPGHFHEVTSLQ